MSDFLFRGSLSEMDPAVYDLTQLEQDRQVLKLILIPSESQAPLAVREAMGSAFQNIYAEGYPDEDSRHFSEAEILDYDERLGYFRRYSDPRYYKGTEYADIVEELSRRRAAECFAANGIEPDDIFVNVQALSGAPANNAVYHALINPGDTILGMSLLHGGHLSHGSSVNRSGKYYNAVHYTVNPDTEQINYDQIEQLAEEHKPKIIIAGYSSYPWSVDWARFQAIAKSVNAYLFADIAHVAGLVAGGVYPSPVGYADVITFTTHKSLCGPRGAVILTTNPVLSRKIDRAVFPGEQGGPHVHIFAAQAVAFRLAKTEQFRSLQQQIVKNCVAFTRKFQELGYRIPFGGTNTHLMNLDVTTISGQDGATLSGDQAARILDLAGIVVNRNTIPGDKNSMDPSGIRMGTPWLTQRGFKETQMVRLAELIDDLLKSITPYNLEGRKGSSRRAKVGFNKLEEVKVKVRELAIDAGRDVDLGPQGYPHFYYIDGPMTDRARTDLSTKVRGAVRSLISNKETFTITGERARIFLNFALSNDIEQLQVEQAQATCLHTSEGEIKATLKCTTTQEFQLSINDDQASLAASWLRDLSDGFIAFDNDIYRKLPGPVVIRHAAENLNISVEETSQKNLKPYYIGIEEAGQGGDALPDFTWQDKEGELRRTPIYDVHKDLGAKIIPFAGWEMPVWYSSVLEEHLAVRQAAGLFDVAHMGVYQAEGIDASVFLDSVVGNDVGSLQVGQSLYTHLLMPAAQVIDDLLVYRRGPEKYMIVVNASNDDKDWAWLNAVRQGKVKVDNSRPMARAFGQNVVLRNLRDPKEGVDMRVDIALQGPRSRDILLAMGVDTETSRRIKALKRTELCEAVVGGFDLVVSRTGYTGEKMAFELFVHPDRAAEFFLAVLKAGEDFSCKPIGLGARDSLRTEAGLPLYGHEMGSGSGKNGQPDLGVAEAGFGSYVKIYKPWFIGREAFIANEQARKGVVVRFRFDEKGVRMAHSGDPVIDKRGRVTGWVTSCAVDQVGYLTGQAFVELKNADEGASIYIYQSAPEKAGKAPAELKPGDKAVLPTSATVISRFPK